MNDTANINPLDDLLDIDHEIESVSSMTLSERRKDKSERAAAREAEPDAELDLDLDIGGLDISPDDIDRTKPLEFCNNPITGEAVCLSNVEHVVRHIIELKSTMAALNTFDTELRKAALHLAVGETKTRRLSAMIDGELRTLEIHLPDDVWPNQELAVLSAWCIAADRAAELGPFQRRFIRAKPKVEYSPVKREVKKLLNETFPEGSLLAQAKEKLLACNHGTTGKLPRVVVEGEKLTGWDRDRYGDGETEE